MDTDKLLESVEPVVLARHLGRTDTRSIYILIVGLGATLITFPLVVWVLTTF